MKILNLTCDVCKQQGKEPKTVSGDFTISSHDYIDIRNRMKLYYEDIDICIECKGKLKNLILRFLEGQ